MERSELGFGKSNVLSLAINGNDIYAGTSSGVWKTSLIGLGINEINNDVHISVFPNPAINSITIEAPKAVGSMQSAVYSIEICNLLGEKVYTSPFTGYCSQVTVNVSDYPSGVYVLEVRTAKGTEVKKFVKE